MTLEQAIADARERAQVLRAEGHGLQALTLERFLDEMSDTDDMRMYLDWLYESDAALYSGREPITLRRHFAALEARHMARWHNGRRQYRRQALDHHGNPSLERAKGREAARA